MKVVALSDTHSKHNKIQLPEGDLLAHAGDFSAMGREKEVIAFVKWFSEQSAKYTFGGVFVAGNHDFVAEKEPVFFKGLVQNFPNIKYLEDETAEIGGKIIHGSPQSPWFHDWAFNVQRGMKIDQFWQLIPENCDLLITHTPPHLILDRTTSGEYVGCADLRKRVYEKNVKHHIFGHIHEGHGQGKSFTTSFYNVAILDVQYQIANPPTVFDI